MGSANTKLRIKCPSSDATLFSGRDPNTHGVRSNPDTVPPGLPWLAERLRQSAYRTAAFVSNPVLRAERGFARGFATYRMFAGPQAMQNVTRAFEEWRRQDWKQPTFIWLHYIDPHGPYR